MGACWPRRQRWLWVSSDLQRNPLPLVAWQPFPADAQREAAWLRTLKATCRSWSATTLVAWKHDREATWVKRSRRRRWSSGRPPVGCLLWCLPQRMRASPPLRPQFTQSSRVLRACETRQHLLFTRWSLARAFQLQALGLHLHRRILAVWASTQRRLLLAPTRLLPWRTALRLRLSISPTLHRILAMVPWKRNLHLISWALVKRTGVPDVLLASLISSPCRSWCSEETQDKMECHMHNRHTAEERKLVPRLGAVGYVAETCVGFPDACTVGNALSVMKVFRICLTATVMISVLRLTSRRDILGFPQLRAITKSSVAWRLEVNMQGMLSEGRCWQPFPVGSWDRSFYWSAGYFLWSCQAPRPGHKTTACLFTLSASWISVCLPAQRVLGRCEAFERCLLDLDAWVR